MGWKIAAAVARADDQTLQQFVDAVYGTPKFLKESSKTADEASYPGLTEGFAMTHAGFHWGFDWRLVGGMTRSYVPLPVRFPVWTFALHSVTNAYSFSVQTNGAFERFRAGAGDDDTIDADIGVPSGAERALVASFAVSGAEDEAWRVWTHTDTSFTDHRGDFTTHDLMGEEIVFGLMKALTGFRIDEDDPAVDAFLAASVMEVARPAGFFSRLFGKR
jgi:hypothetical protein